MDLLQVAEARLLEIQNTAQHLIVERNELLVFKRIYERLRNSPEGASPAGRFESGSLTEIGVKPQVQVLPVDGETVDKGGPTGMGRSDSGESLINAEETSLASSSAPVSEPAGLTHLADEEGEGVRTAPSPKVSGEPEGPSAEPTTGPDDEEAAALAANEGGEDESLTQQRSGEGSDSPLPKRNASNVRGRARADLLEHHHDHPEHTITEAADFLGLTRRSVVIMSRDLSIRWNNKPASAPEPVIEEPAEVAGEGETTTLPGQTNILPFEPARFGSPEVVHVPMKRGPKGRRFRLTDGEGNYLHLGCNEMVKGVKNSWEGNEDQLAACRKKFPLARDLAERVVEKVK